jgi:preprotein translocase subunit SecG
LFNVWLVFHIIVCFALVGVVLMQSSKGGGLAGSAFGGGGGSGLGGAVFGGRGAASFLSKATSVLAVVFMLNCLALAYMSSTTRVASSSDAGATGESVVTQKAQAERDRAMQQQAAQQPIVADTADLSLEEIIGEGETAPATDGN